MSIINPSSAARPPRQASESGQHTAAQPSIRSDQTPTAYVTNDSIEAIIKTRSATNQTPKMAAGCAKVMEALAQREIATSLAGYQNWISATYQGMLETSAVWDDSQQKYSSDAPLVFHDVVWQGDTALVRFQGKSGTLRTQQVTPTHPGLNAAENYAVLQNYRAAFAAQDQALSSLDKNTLRVLIKGPKGLRNSDQASILSTHLLAREWKNASNKLLSSMDLGPGRWAPTMEMGKLDGNYIIVLSNLDRPEQLKPVKIDQALFRKFFQVKRVMEQQLAIVRNQLGQDEARTSDTPAVEAVLDASYRLKLLQLFLSPEQNQAGHPASASAIDYFSGVQNGFSYARMAVTGSSVANGILSATDGFINKATAWVGWSARGTQISRAGLLLDVINLGLAGIELVRASPEQRARLVPNVVFKTLGVLLGAVTVGGAYCAPVTIPASIALFVCGMGIGKMAKDQAEALDRLIALGEELQTMSDSSRAGGMRYDLQQQALIPRMGAVVQDIDLTQMTVGMASPSIYGSQPYSGPGMGKPSVNHGQLISLLERQEIATSAKLPPGSNAASTVILPGMSNYLVDYSYGDLLGILGRDDAGLRFMRGIGAKQGDLIVSHKATAMTQLTRHYQATPVKVKLGEVPRRLQMPKYPDVSLDSANREQAMLYAGMRGKISYQLQAKHGQFVIGLQSGAASLNLESEEPQATEWILDARDLASDDISFDANGLTVGGVRINIAAKHQASKLTIIGKDGRKHTLDIAQQRRTAHAMPAISEREMRARQLVALSAREIDRSIVSYQRYLNQDLVAYLSGRKQLNLAAAPRFEKVEPVGPNAVMAYFREDSGTLRPVMLAAGHPAFPFLQAYPAVLAAKHSSLDGLSEAALQGLALIQRRNAPEQNTKANLFEHLATLAPEQRAQWLAQLLSGTGSPSLSHLMSATLELNVATPAVATPAPAQSQTLTQFGAELQAMVDQAQAGAVRVDHQQQAFYPMPGMVFEEIDLENQSIRLDSPRIRAKAEQDDDTLSELVYPQASMSVNSFSEIPLLARLKAPMEARLPDGAVSAQTLHLPSTPRSVMTYGYHNYNIPKPGVAPIPDTDFPGSALVRQLQGEDFSAISQSMLPGAIRSVIDQIEHHYQPTRTTIKLGSLPRRVQMARIEDARMQNKLSYDLRANSGEFELGLMPGASLLLESLSPGQTHWRLDARALDSEQVEFHDWGLMVGGVRIEIPTGQEGLKLTLIGKNGETKLVRPSRRPEMAVKQQQRQAIHA